MSLNIEQLKSDIDSIARSLGIQQYDVYGSTKEESSANPVKDAESLMKKKDYKADSL